MALEVTPDQLQVGDIYADRPSTLRPHPELRMVTAMRTVRYAETYDVLETKGLDTGLHGEISLNRATAKVTLVRQYDPIELRAIVESIVPGTSLTIHRRQNGELYA